jgi:hypothetical protein
MEGWKDGQMHGKTNEPDKLQGSPPCANQTSCKTRRRPRMRPTPLPYITHTHLFTKNVALCSCLSTACLASVCFFSLVSFVLFSSSDDDDNEGSCGKAVK